MTHVEYTHRGVRFGVPKSLINRQEVSDEGVQAIIVLHKERYDLHQLLKSTKDRALMKIIYHQTTNIEFELQMLWGFQTDIIYHRSWLLTHCTCPYMDNQDAFPVVQYYNENCPLHEDEFNER